MANQLLISNLKFLTDKALNDMTNGYEDPNIEQTMSNYINSGAIATGGQSYEKTLQEAVTYYKYIKGEVSMGSGSLSDPLLANMKLLSDKAIADRKSGYNDPNIEETMRQMVRSGQILTGGQTEEKTVSDAVSYYKYIKGPDSISGYGGTGTNNNNTTTTSTTTSTSTTNNNSSSSNTSNTNSSQSTTSSSSTASSSSTSTATTPSSSSSTTSRSNTLSLKDGNISDIIAATNGAINDIDNLLNKITNTEITTINNSWAAQETSKYVDKVNQTVEKMRNINKALELLSSTYEKALRMNEETSKQVNTYVNNI